MCKTSYIMNQYSIYMWTHWRQSTIFEIYLSFSLLITHWLEMWNWIVFHGFYTSYHFARNILHVASLLLYSTAIIFNKGIISKLYILFLICFLWGWFEAGTCIVSWLPWVYNINRLDIELMAVLKFMGILYQPTRATIAVMCHHTGLKFSSCI